MNALSKGQQLNSRYTLIAPLGDGGMSAVWLANDAELNIRVALKILVNPTATTRRQLGNEYALLKKLDHPAIVRVYDLSADTDPALLAEEYLAGGDLTSFSGRPYRQYLPFFIQAAEGLGHLHDAGWVHRDLKLANLCLDDGGQIRLTDFGIASPSGAGGLTSGGSPLTASPAQLDGAPPAAADDIYSLGAALYEIATGQPPGEIADLSAVPPQLQDLVSDMLAAVATERPTSMHAVRERLQQAWDADSNATIPPDEMDFIDEEESDALIVPLSMESDVGALTRSGTRKTLSRGAVFMLFWYLVAGVVGVFYYLPKFSQPAQAVLPSATESSAGTATAARPAPAIEPWKLAQLAREQKAAEEILDRLLTLQFDLDDQQVHVWAAEEYETARQKAIDGDKAFRRRDFPEARQLYTEGEEILAALTERAGTLLDDNLSAGEAAIEKGFGETAVQHFELVLKVDKKNRRAAVGLARARTVSEVIALVERGRELEQQGDLDAALAKYRAARKLDSQWSAAGDGIGRINRRVAGARFSDTMSSGYRALEAQDFAGARAAFNRAGEMRSGSAEVAEALAQVDVNTRAIDIEGLRARAESAERREDWDGALAMYRSALELDGGLSFARDGERRVEDRATLQRELDEYIANPVSLSSDSVYGKAQKALERAQAVADRGPGLSTKIGQLRRLMAASRTTLSVQLTSDNSTEIVVNQVGRLGRFEARRLDLRPGNYTAIGSRKGYRDVRLDFTVTPGQDPPIVDVRCEEKI